MIAATVTRPVPRAKPLVVLLGPQRFDPTLGETVRSLGIRGTIATVTAGWQEREGEDSELRDHLNNLDVPTVNLMLHGRAEQAFQDDPELAASHRLRQERIRQIQLIYQMRLAHAKEAARDLFAREGFQADEWLLDPERQDAMRVLRDLDGHHLRRLREVHAMFERAWRPWERPSVARHRQEIARILEDASALTIAGGHVAVLLNRLRLFGIAEMASSLPVLAWSAGAMVVCERIVLFHDSPAQGQGDPAVLDDGLGLVPRVLALPHARKRLRLDDPIRVALFARRFAPAACVAFDGPARLDWNHRKLTAGPGTMRLTRLGVLQPMGEA